MIYQKTVTVAKDTLPVDADRSILTVTKGLIYQVEIYFPPGSAGLLHVVVMDGGYQAWPSTPGETFQGENILLSFPDTYLKEAAPFNFTIITYNMDDTYSHAVTIRLGMVSQEIFQARFLPTYTYKYFMEMLETLREKQQREQQEQAAMVLETPFPWLET